VPPGTRPARSVGARLRRSIDIEALALPGPDALPRPRLLALDIDGTLLDDRRCLRPAVSAAVRRVAASGVHVILATGRSPWFGVADLASELGLSGPQVTMQGACVVDFAPPQVHRLRVLTPQVYREAIRLADELGLDPIVALPDGHRAERLADSVDFIPESAGEAGRFRYVENLGALVDHRPVRVFLPTGPDRHRAVRGALAERFAGRASIVWSDLSGVELLARETHKGEAVAWLAGTMGIAMEEVVAVGDATNDIELLRMAGRSAGMGSAPIEVRASASIVVPGCAQEGVVVALSSFFPDADLADLSDVSDIAEPERHTPLAMRTATVSGALTGG